MDIARLILGTLSAINQLSLGKTARENAVNLRDIELSVSLRLASDARFRMLVRGNHYQGVQPLGQRIRQRMGRNPKVLKRTFPCMLPVGSLARKKGLLEMKDEKYFGFDKVIKDSLVAARGQKLGESKEEKIMALERKLETAKLTPTEILELQKKLKQLKSS